ncbi:MAG TPA: phosphatase PAP2 family protein [Candidatus Polarisedimenticolaceae bacterium]|nr:phosphatase PAP2 family protein [Candidatus Polarisedimenticolaceae bacterium]
MSSLRRRAFGLALALSVLLPGLALADDGEPPQDKPYWRTNLFKRFALDQKFLVVHWFPAELRRPAFTAPLVGAILLASHPSDRASQADFGSDVPSGGIHLSHQLTFVGNAPFVAAALGLTYLTSRRAEDDHLAEAASLSGEALMSVGLWSTVLKTVASRTRPGPASSGGFFQYGAPRSGSFPSGHAMVAFSIATVFADEYRDHRWAPWLAYGTAGLIGAARIAVGQHYPSDVIFGAVLGHSIGSAVIARQRERGDGWYDRLQPYYDESHRGWGIAYVRRW